MLAKGKYRAIAVEWGLGYTQGNKPQMVVNFDLLDHPGEQIPWYGYFSEAAIDRTFESLRHCGWSCDRLDVLEGMGTREVQLVVEHDTYEGKTTAKVRWVNRAGGLAVAAPMDAGDLAAFAAKMKGAAVASRQRTGTPKPAAVQARVNGARSSQPEPPPHSDTDIPF